MLVKDGMISIREACKRLDMTQHRVLIEAATGRIRATQRPNGYPLRIDPESVERRRRELYPESTPRKAPGRRPQTAGARN